MLSVSRYFISARPRRIQLRLSRLVGAHPDALSFEPHANPGHPAALYPTARRCPLLAAVAFAALSSCRGGCRRGSGRRPRADRRRARLALFPAAARIVAGVDVAPAARQPGRRQGRRRWRSNRRPTRSRSPNSSAAPASIRSSRSPASRSPSPRTRARSGDFGLVLRADRFDEARLVAYARDELQKKGDDLVATKRGRLTLWSSKRDPTVVGFFIDEQTFALGAGGWGARMADLAGQDQPRRQRRHQPGARPPGRTRGGHARDLGRRDGPRRDPPLAGGAAGPRRGGDDQHAVGRDRLRQGPGGGADRRHGDR